MRNVDFVNPNSVRSLKFEFVSHNNQSGKFYYFIGELSWIASA